MVRIRRSAYPQFLAMSILVVPIVCPSHYPTTPTPMKQASTLKLMGAPSGGWPTVHGLTPVFRRRLASTPHSVGNILPIYFQQPTCQHLPRNFLGHATLEKLEKFGDKIRGQTERSPIFPNSLQTPLPISRSTFVMGYSHDTY